MFRVNYFVLLIVIILLIGCSAGSDSPVGVDFQPGASDVDNIKGTTSDPHHAPICWGVWEITIDPYTGSYEITPLRNAEFMANVTMFLQPPAGSLQNFILKDMAVDMDSQPGFIIIDVDVGLQHPFPGLDQYTGFDVRGVFMQDYQYTSASESQITYAGPDVARQLNPDGHTRWMNAKEFTTNGILGFTEGKAGSPGYSPSATLNPYKYYCDGLEEDQKVADFFSDPDNIDNRGYFRPGSVNYRHYSLIWPEGILTFQYAVIASYEECDPVPPENIPDDFPWSANCPEAFNLEITDNGSTAYYESPSSKGGDLFLNLEIFDWGVLGQSSTVAEEIGSIVFESTGGLIASPITFDPALLTATPGTDISSVYQIDIPGVDPDGLTDQTVLCRVTSAKHDTYDFGYGTACPEDPLAAYLLFDAPILAEPTGDPPTAIANDCSCLWIAPGESVTFDGTQSWSPNGIITDWDWDFDGDGTFGDAYTGAPEHPTHTYLSAGDYYVNLRVTDIIGLTDTLDPSEQLHVQVSSSWTPPTANSHIVPTIGFINFAGNFVGSGSTGAINLYEWDFEPDCIWDYEHATIGDTTHAYNAPGYYYPTLRVTGNGCDSVDTEVRMIEPLGILQNGNFWDGTWAPWTHGHGGVPYATYLEELLPNGTFPNDDFKYIVHFHRSGTNDGGVTWIMQDLNYDCTGHDELYVNLFFYIDQSTLDGDGWMGGEMDMHLRIVYDDGNGSAPYWRQAFFGWDGQYDGNWQWDDPAWHWPYCFYNEQEQVAEDTWHERKTCNLMTMVDPPPIEIKWIMLESHGWGWDTYCTMPWFSEE